MKLTFSAKESIYKIFHLLKKVPRGKHVDIFLDDHPLLQDPRRTETFVKYLRELEITASVTTKNQQLYDQLTNFGVEAKYIWQKPWLNRLLQLGSAKKPLFFWVEQVKSKLALIAEILVLVTIVYLFWGTISPTATVTITPTTLIQPISYGFLLYPQWQLPELTVSPLSIARYTGSIERSASKTSNLDDATFFLTPAQWTVALYNTLPKPISLIEKTVLIAQTNALYTLDRAVTIPAGSKKNPWIAQVSITAQDYFENWLPIGEEWNITTEDKLRIQKLPESMDEKAIWATPIADITNWKTEIKWTVISSDIQRLEANLLKEVRNQLDWIIRSKISNEYLHVPLDKEITVQTIRFVTNAQPWESASFLQWTIDLRITYPYIKKSDLKKQAEQYLQQRSSSNIHQWWISIDQIEMYEPRTITTWSYSLPITLQTYNTYDFENDNYDIIPQLKESIAWHSREEAKAISLRFNEINDIAISISPFRYTLVPKSVKNITLTIKQ